MTEDTAWDAYKHAVKPVRRTAKTLAVPLKADKAERRRAAATVPATIPKAAVHPPPKDTPLERRREKALRQGEVKIEARLDLHGLTQAQAFAALAAFMHKKTKTGQRHLLIITGKGRNAPTGRDGVLRAHLKDWLHQLPEAKAILAIRQASVRHGGDGAFYVLMRKS